MSFDESPLGKIALAGDAGLVDGPFGSNLPASEYQPKGIPLIRGSNLSRGEVRFKSSDFAFVSEAVADRLSRSICVPRDIVFTKKGTLGQVGIVPPRPYEKYLLSSNQMRLRVDETLANADYVYYALSTKESIEKIVRESEHTGVPKINLAYIRRFCIPMPPRHIQDEICDFLLAVDAIITLLRETNATLEAISQALFKSWFVDFDPVRSKVEGRVPDGIDKATASLFPNSFEDGQMVQVPTGWKLSTVGESFVLTMGQSPPGHTFNETGEGIAFYQGRTDFGFRFPTQRVFCSTPTRLAEAGDTLVSVRAPVGDVNMAIERCGIGRGVASVRHADGYRGFTFFAMRGLAERFKTFDSEGTVFGSINRTDFQNLPVIHPPTALLKAYDDVTSPINMKVVENEVSARTLTKLRETLLPRLISGQLRLSDAKEMVLV